MSMREFVLVDGLEEVTRMEDEGILEFTVAHNLVVSNTSFAKSESHQVTSIW